MLKCRDILPRRNRNAGLHLILLLSLVRTQKAANGKSFVPCPAQPESCTVSASQQQMNSCERQFGKRCESDGDCKIVGSVCSCVKVSGRFGQYETCGRYCLDPKRDRLVSIFEMFGTPKWKTRGSLDLMCYSGSGKTDPDPGYFFEYLRSSAQVNPLGTLRRSSYSPIINSNTRSGTTQHSIKWDFDDLTCKDDKTHCFYCYTERRRNFQVESNALAFLVSVPPGNPKPRIINVVNDTVVEEGTVVVECEANIGKPEVGYIGWRIIRGGRSETAGFSHNSENVKVIDLTHQIPAADRSGTGDKSCTKVFRSRLELSKVGPIDVPLQIECYVSNKNYKDLEKCWGTYEKNCARTPLINTIEKPELTQEEKIIKALKEAGFGVGAVAFIVVILIPIMCYYCRPKEVTRIKLEDFSYDSPSEEDDSDSS